MKIANTRKINERIQQYIEREELNALIGMNVGEPFSQNLKFENPSLLDEFARDFRADLEKEGIELSKDESIIASMLMTVLNEKMGGVSEFPKQVFFDIVFNGMVFHKGSFGTNEYLNNVIFEEEKVGRFTIKYNSYSKYEAFHYSIPIFSPNGYLIPLIGTFKYRFKYPCIEEDGVTWMSVTPNEILTMERPIEEATKRVLTLGCGMGYFAYMVSLKSDVEHVTIIEREQEVIDLFTEHILPHFKDKEKITIIKSDACEYMKNLKDGEFDYCFADLWLGNNDIKEYLKLKNICAGFEKMKVSYWIEGSLVYSLMQYVHLIITGQQAINMKTEPMVPSEMSDDDREIINYLEGILDDEEIKSVEDVDRYMDYNTIIKLIETR